MISDAKDHVTQPTIVQQPRRPRAPLGLRLLRALSGTVAAGLVILAAVTAVAAWVTDADGAPGPGTGIVIGHLVIALLAVALQIAADRSGRPLRVALAVLGVLVLANAALWSWWWN